MGRVVVAGDVLVDVAYVGGDVREDPGGSALNVATGLATLGVGCVLRARLGHDAGAELIRQSVRDSGVALVESSSPCGTGRAVSTRNSDGEPSYEFNEAVLRRFVDLGGVGEADFSPQLLVLSGVPLDNDEQVDAVLAAAGRVPTVLDPNPRPALLASAGRFAEGLEAVASRCRLVKVSSEDAELLGYEDLDSLARRLLDAGADVVVGTRGGAGATVLTKEFTARVGIAERHTPVLDTMGAGDSVLASIVADMVVAAASAEADWIAMLARAMEIAADTCRNAGPRLVADSRR